MATVNLGKIKLKWRGTWSSGGTYAIDDVVEYADGSVISSFIAVAASSNQAPSSSGTVNTSYWNLLAKGQATSPTTTQGDLIVRGASADQRLAIGAAGKALKVNSSGNGLEYGAGGGVLGMKEIEVTNWQTLSLSDSSWTGSSSAFEISYTATSTTSYFLLEAFLSLGSEHHDLMFTMNWWDSLKGLSNGNELFTLANVAGGRRQGTFATFASGAGVSSAWDDYWFDGKFFSALYYPAAAHRSTSARTFKPCFRRNGYDYNMIFNYSNTDNGVGLTGISKVRVTEIEGGIIQ